PFVRQFAHVDKNWFEASRYTQLIQWLNDWLMSDVFVSVMIKYSQWKEGDESVYFPL
ncbi:MAG: glutathione S-transferase, partial [Oceanospirillales bacterium]